MMENGIAQQKFSQYICDAIEAVSFKLVKEVSDLESEDGFFHPDMSHQIFGEKEQIFGYSNLQIKIFYSASFLYAYVKVSYTRKLNSKQCDGVEPDNIMLKLKDVLPSKFYTNIDDFSSIVQKEDTFRPYGHHINTYSRDAIGCSMPRQFEVYKADIHNPQFRKYHNRMESFILWFIDAASYIDVDDEKWDYYVLFEKCVRNGRTRHLFAGYCTCYRFYAYPDMCRPRISQVLVLPPYQRQGHCSTLISTIYQEYVPRKDVLDITAEDPSENFQRVRDFVDAKNCITLKEFLPANLHGRFTKEMAASAKAKFKINKRQARRVYEILRLLNTNENNDVEFIKYRTVIKTRINQPMRDLRRKCQMLMNNPSLLPPKEEQEKMVEREFEHHLEEYHRVINRLKST
ncbi:unnamed protein product [Clavelina lepadiformis]|uniref:Histone acetyltransferase type B catalytic subunit n=1 Tax=Clavelina lepadiformis TaxID=159417 RepID=A0ABP0FTP5_CLALP